MSQIKNAMDQINRLDRAKEKMNVSKNIEIEANKNKTKIKDPPNFKKHDE